MSTFQKGNEEATAKQATSLAKFVGDVASRQRAEDNGNDIDHGTALHLLAAEQHSRASDAHMALANKNADSKTLSKEHTKLAQHHRDQQIAHSKEVQRLAGIAIKASDAARAAGKAAKTPEQHKLAAEAHKNAANMNWDRESKAEHQKMADWHGKQAKVSPGGQKGDKKGDSTKKALPDTLEDATADAESLLKAHVKQHTRRTKSGGVVTVKEHEDARASKGVHLNRKMEGKTYAGQEVRIIVAATTSGGKKLHALKTTTGATIATTYGDPSELQEYAKNKWLKVVEHEDARQSHPNVIGVADGLDDHPEKASGFTFEGRRYYSTGKSGNSLHDGTPVREFEAGKEHNYHRAWLDHSGRVHADDITEAARYRKK